MFVLNNMYYSSCYSVCKGSVTNYSAEVWCSIGQWMWIETVVHNVLINKPECVHYDDVVVNEII